MRHQSARQGHQSAHESGVHIVIRTGFQEESHESVPYHNCPMCCGQRCYDLRSSLHKRNDLQGKDGSTSILQDLTNGSAWMNMEDDIRWAGVSSFKGQPLTMAAEAGVEDIGSDGYR